MFSNIPLFLSARCHISLSKWISSFRQSPAGKQAILSVCSSKWVAKRWPLSTFTLEGALEWSCVLHLHLATSRALSLIPNFSNHYMGVPKISPVGDTHSMFILVLGNRHNKVAVFGIRTGSGIFLSVPRSRLHWSCCSWSQWAMLLCFLMQRLNIRWWPASWDLGVLIWAADLLVTRPMAYISLSWPPCALSVTKKYPDFRGHIGKYPDFKC